MKKSQRPQKLAVKKKTAKKTKLVSSPKISKTQRSSTLPKVSLILVTHKEEAELKACLTSLFASHTLNGKADPQPFEVIVVDNNPESKLQAALKKSFPKVRYVRSGANIGFGPANNLGAKHATGDHFFFLNPDTEVEPGAIRALTEFLVHHPKAGVVAPTLYTMDGVQPYPDQGSAELTPLTGLASYSIFHSIWPTNPIAQKYWVRGRDLTKPQQLGVIPGTALMVRREAFEQIGSFDEQFFIYFEESDLCRRLRQEGWEVWLTPEAKIRHIWHAATRAAKYQIIFEESRYKYFKKYYGKRVADLVEVVMHTGKYELLGFLLLILCALAITAILLTRL